MKNNCIVVLGPTASGKTHFACRMAREINGEIISADSRQVYKDLNIGTGKDLEEYSIEGTEIPYHLINICDPQQQYYLHDFIRDCAIAFQDIQQRGKLPVICGGTGLYLDALKKDFSYTQIKESPALRSELEKESTEKLLSRLKTFSSGLTGQVDVHSRKRIIRGIEIAEYFKSGGKINPQTTVLYDPFYIGVKIEREENKKNISRRLKARLNSGMIEEVEKLLADGVSYERLQFLGLEYRIISSYVKGKSSYEEMYAKLETGIFQYAKRQMTWFRKMEKEGVKIHWIEPHQNPADVLSAINEDQFK